MEAGGARPDAVGVALRCAAIGAIVARGAAEYSGGEAPDPQDVIGWLESAGATAMLTDDEAELLARPFGTWDEPEIIDAGWRSEAAGVLLWALRASPTIWPYDRQFPDSHLAELTGFMVRPWVAAGESLRPDSELNLARDTAEIWHVRSMVEDATRRDEPPAGGETFEVIVAELVQEALRLGAIDAGEGADLPFLARPYREITDDALLLAQSIAYERYSALVWVCGGA